MKYEGQIITSLDKKKMIKVILSNTLKKNGGFRICFYEKLINLKHELYTYKDDEYFVYNDQYVLDNFNDFWLSLTRTINPTINEIVLMVFDKFSSYEYMDSTDFSYNNNGFCITFILDNTLYSSLDKYNNDYLDQYYYMINSYHISFHTSILDIKSFNKELAFILGI